MDNNNINFNAFNFQSDADKLMAGATGLLSNLEKSINDTLKNMGPEHAMAFAKAFNENNIESKINEIKKDMEVLKNKPQ